MEHAAPADDRRFGEQEGRTKDQRLCLVFGLRDGGGGGMGDRDLRAKKSVPIVGL